MRPSAISAASDVLVATERRTRLCRYDPTSGEVLWEVEVYNAHGFLAVGRDVVLYLDQTGTLACFESENGHRRWSVDGERFSGHLFVSDTVVFLGGWRGYRPFGARDLATGRVLWRSEIDPATDRPVDVHWPILNGDSVLVSARGSRVIERIDPTTGTVRGKLQVHEPIVSADHRAAYGPTPSGSVIFRIGAADVAELDEGGVAQIWRGPPDLDLGSPPVLIAGKLWTTVAQGMAVLDPQTNDVEIVDIQEGLAPGLGMVNDVVLVASRAGDVLALASDGTKVARLNLSSRSSGLYQVSEYTAVIATKGELVGVRYSND